MTNYGVDMTKEFSIEIAAEQFESLSDIEKEYYEQQGDKYVATSLLPLKSALELEKAKREPFKGLNAEEAKKALELSKTIDFDIDKAREALRQQAENERKGLIEKGDFDKALTHAQEEAEAKIKAAESRVSGIAQGFGRKQIELMMRDNGVKDTLADLATIAVLEQVKIRERDGEIEFVNNDGIGDAADFKKIISGLKETRGDLFKSEQLTGSGANGNGGGGGAARRGKWDDLNRAGRAEAIREHGNLEEARRHYQ